MKGVLFVVDTFILFDLRPSQPRPPSRPPRLPRRPLPSARLVCRCPRPSRRPIPPGRPESVISTSLLSPSPAAPGGPEPCRCIVSPAVPPLPSAMRRFRRMASTDLAPTGSAPRRSSSACSVSLLSCESKSGCPAGAGGGVPCAGGALTPPKPGGVEPPRRRSAGVRVLRPLWSRPEHPLLSLCGGPMRAARHGPRERPGVATTASAISKGSTCAQPPRPRRTHDVCPGMDSALS